MFEHFNEMFLLKFYFIAMQAHPGFVDSFGFSLIDHRGGDLLLNHGEIKVSIPDGAIAKGNRILFTLRVPGSGGRFPLQSGEVRITPDVLCSTVGFNLRKPAMVTLPHCLAEGEGCKEIALCTRKETGKWFLKLGLP